MRITATRFETKEVHPIDVHTMDDLLEVHRYNQLELSWGNKKTKFLVKFLDFRTTLRSENNFHGFYNHFNNSKVTMAI